MKSGDERNEAMRWKNGKKIQPKCGAEREQHGPLWWPKTIDGETRWLEYTSWMECFGGIPRVGSSPPNWHGANGWVPYSWDAPLEYPGDVPPPPDPPPPPIDPEKEEKAAKVLGEVPSRPPPVTDADKLRTIVLSGPRITTCKACGSDEIASTRGDTWKCAGCNEPIA